MYNVYKFNGTDWDLVDQLKKIDLSSYTDPGTQIEYSEADASTSQIILNIPPLPATN